MKFPILGLGVSLLLIGCGPNPTTQTTQTTETPDGQTVTKTTTVTTAPPAAPSAPAPSPLTQANLDRVQDDMSQAEVEAIFGPPTSSDSQPIPIVGGTQTTYNYQSGGSAVTIVFKNNQVKSKSGTFGP
jgi:hypothetical protein